MARPKTQECGARLTSKKGGGHQTGTENEEATNSGQLVRKKVRAQTAGRNREVVPPGSCKKTHRDRMEGKGVQDGEERRFGERGVPK